MKRLLWIVAGVFVVTAITVVGFFHMVHGGANGWNVCAKENWGLIDTFVDVRDYVDQPVGLIPPKPAVIRALIRCGDLLIESKLQK